MIRFFLSKYFEHNLDGVFNMKIQNVIKVSKFSALISEAYFRQHFSVVGCTKNMQPFKRSVGMLLTVRDLTKDEILETRLLCPTVSKIIDFFCFSRTCSWFELYRSNDYQ